jgi:hypothetical protein
MTQAKADGPSRRSLIAGKRRRYFVDRDVQGAFLKHGMFYWLYACLVFGAIVFIYRVFPALLSGEAGNVWYHLGPFLLASAVLFPVVVWNSIRFSHRFAGPMVRARRALRELASGENPGPIAFRENDFWPEVAGYLNQIGHRLEKTNGETAINFRPSDLDPDQGGVPAERQQVLELASATSAVELSSP